MEAKKVEKTAVITGVVEQVSFDLSIPSIEVNGRNYRAFLKFMPDELKRKLEWKVTLFDLKQN